MYISENIKQKIPILICLIVVVFIFKPKFIFKPDGEPRQYGFGYDDTGFKRTLYTPQLVVLILALIVWLF
jgi:hypothetical protein